MSQDKVMSKNVAQLAKKEKIRRNYDPPAVKLWVESSDAKGLHRHREVMDFFAAREGHYLSSLVDYFHPITN